MPGFCRALVDTFPRILVQILIKTDFAKYHILMICKK